MKSKLFLDWAQDGIYISESHPKIKLEKNIPIPPRHPWGYWPKFLKGMPLGSSFIGTKIQRNTLLVICRRYKVKLTTRLLRSGKVRIWRIK